MDGRQLLATIDTAAQVTVIQREIWAKLGFLGEGETVTLTQADGNSPLISSFFRNRVISVGVASVKANIFVFSIMDPMLLGLDVLISLGATLDIPRSKLSFQKGQVDIFIGPVDPVVHSWAYVNGTCIVNPGSSKFVSLTYPVHMKAALGMGLFRRSVRTGVPG